MRLVKKTKETIDEMFTIEEKDVMKEMEVTKQRIVEGIKHDDLCWCKCNISIGK